VILEKKKERPLMNLKSISDSDLLRETKRHAAQEKESGIQVLHHLREVDARKLFTTVKCSSLYAYCIKELGYSEGTAGRRIQAMKLIRDLPEYQAKLEEGSVHEGHLSKAQTFFNAQKKKKKAYSKEKKLQVMKDIEGKSARETDQLFASIDPKLARKDKARPINQEETEIRFTADKKLMEKLEKLQNLLGHQLDDKKYATLIEELADLALKKLEPKSPPTLAVKEVSATRYIPAKIKRAVWHRDQGRCTHPGCGSKYALQYEHIIPFSKGGKSSLENLKLLCPAHNQLAAIQAYGLAKMQEHWKT
jgi:5-methylcytosine-specific restriction endonuclease McrA